MSLKYEEREVYVVDVPQPDGFEVLRPEQVVLRFENGLTVDIGALCFMQRAEDRRKPGQPNVGRKVITASLNAARIKRVRRLISDVSEVLRDTGARPETVRDRYSRLIAFIGWADKNEWESAIDDAASARSALQAYIACLWDRVGRNEISINSGARQQFSTLAALEQLLDVEDLGRGLNLLRTDPSSKEGTSPPDEAVQGRVLALCTALFDGLCKLVLDGLPYPYALSIPEYLDLPNNRLWVFPLNSWFKTPAMETRRNGRRHSVQGYNFQAGRVATLDELRTLQSSAVNRDPIWRVTIGKASRNIQAANDDARHWSRCASANRAMNQFIILFVSQTGMNWSQVVHLTWDDNYLVEPSKQGFRTIKWRAGSKHSSFELPIGFMPKFVRYLALRRYLLGGQTCGLLFFSAGSNGHAQPRMMTVAGGLDSIYMTLQRIDPALPQVNSREWRAAKSDWLLRNTDVATTALVLQNTKRTVMQSYAEGSETTAMEEVGGFLDKVSTTVLDRGATLDAAVERAVGKCAQFGEPISEFTDVAIKPDCGSPEGCLFCNKFKVHADEVDTRKLASCRHCVRLVAPSAAGGEGRSAELFTPIISRIDGLLGQIAGRDAAMVERVVRDVDTDGELDPFWARKLEMLMELGLVA